MIDRDDLKHTYRPLPDCLAVGSSKIEGVGLIATAMLAKGVLLGPSHLYLPNYDSPNDLVRLPMGGFINHSDIPNCSLVKWGDYYFVEPKRRILPSEELTLDYRKTPCANECKSVTETCDSDVEQFGYIEYSVPRDSIDVSYDGDFMCMKIKYETKDIQNK